MCWLLLLASLFVSSDLIALSPGGFTLRPSEVCMALIAMAVVFRFMDDAEMRWPLGFGWLLLWTLLVIIFVPNTHFLLRNIGYAAWLVFNVAFVFAVVQVLDTSKKVRFVLRGYAFSFGVIAAFGLLQFFLPFFHVNPPLLRQWWIEGRLVRINGLSYEPSYFAVYIASGWVFLISLAQLKSNLLRPRELRWLIILTSASLLLSGSRSGWGVMLIWLFLNLLTRNVKLFVSVIAFLLITLATSWYVMNKYQMTLEDLQFLMTGTGLGGTDSQSVDFRLGIDEETIELFKKSPIMGVSLGGIAPAIGERYHNFIVSQDAAKPYEGQSSSLEILAATGVIGFAFYAAYIFVLFLKPWILSRQSKILRALVFSFIAVIGVMQNNGNILRGFVWMHIALLSATYAVVNKEYSSRVFESEIQVAQP